MSPDEVRIWREDVEGKIKEGVYKLLDLQNDSHRRSTVWTIFTKVSNKYGEIIENTVFCRECSRAFRSQGNSTSSLMRHNCYRMWKSRMEHRKMETTANIYRKRLKAMPKQQNSTIVEYNFDFDRLNRTIDTNLKNGTYTLKPNRDTNDPIWKNFAFIALKGSGNIMKDVIYCRQCRTIVKYNVHCKQYLYEHVCGKEDRLRIGFKVKNGIYKLLMNESTESNVWILFALIAKGDETIMKDHVYCTVCSEIVSYRTSELSNHKCYVNMGFNNSRSEASFEKVCPNQVVQERIAKAAKNTTDFGMKVLQKSIENKIKAGTYMLSTIQVANNNPLWKIFGSISKEDGSTLRGMVCCRQCLMVLKYDGENTNELQQHTCYSKTYGANKTKSPREEQRDLKNNSNYRATPSSSNSMQSGDDFEEYIDNIAANENATNPPDDSYSYFIIEELEDPSEYDDQQQIKTEDDVIYCGDYEMYNYNSYEYETAT
ncbi:uncharacterized protein LOC142230118 [Haematobia irritans]|uniref:uncharacterized protein LOC142230118 n=1 Tax=Haematobia irritans TaxID=7368 RepID=UPI003F4F7774